MQITYRYVHLDHTPSLEDVAARKLESIGTLVSAYDNARAEVVFERTTGHHQGGNVFRVAMRLFVQGQEIDADATGDDVYALVDVARDTLHGAVQRFKEQDVARRHAGE